jgi:hypothetical protein
VIDFTVVPENLNFATTSKGLLPLFYYYVLYGCNILSRQLAHSVVGIVTRYGLEDLEVGVPVAEGSRTFCSPRRRDRPWGSPNLLSNEYREIFPEG